MKKLPLVTVIIPTYKRPIMLEKAIKSVINQTYKNIEIIVVDDNKYNSKEHINTKNMIKNYPNVRYYKNKKNIGHCLHIIKMCLLLRKIFETTSVIYFFLWLLIPRDD